MAPAFVDLPAEIRLMIYGYLLTCAKPAWIWLSAESPSRGSRAVEYCPTGVRRGFHPAILRVNKKIHQESSHFLYTQNHFWLLSELVEKDETFVLFRKMGRHSALIRHVGIAFPDALDSQPDREIFSLSMDTVSYYCPNLTTVELSVSSGPWVYLSDAPVLDFLDGVLRKMENLQEIIVTDRVPEYPKRVEDWRIEMAAWSERGWKVKFGRKKNWLFFTDRPEGFMEGWRSGWSEV